MLQRLTSTTALRVDRLKQEVTTAVRRASDVFAAASVPFLTSSYIDADPPAVTNPPFFDNFNREDGPLGTSASGHRWAVVPTNGAEKVEPEIRAGLLTAAPSPVGRTAAYPAIALSEIARSVRAEISFAPGQDGGAAALILTRSIPDYSTVAHIVDEGAVHIVFTNRKVKVGLFKDRDFFELAVFYYPRALSKEGTIYKIGFDVAGDLLTIFAPGLAPRAFKHPRVIELAGRFVTYETFFEEGQCAARFHQVAAA